MRLIAFSLAAFALSATCLLAVFLYALHVPSKTSPLIASPSTIELRSKPEKDWPERWAAQNLRTVLK